MKKELVAVILAGGEGKRFWPLNVSKPLFPYFGKPLLEYSVLQVLPYEVTRLIIVTNKENDRAVGQMSFSVPHVTVIQQEPRGMADALITAEQHIKDASLLVINGDDISDRGLYSSVIHKAQTTDAFGVIPGWKTDVYRSLGYVVLDGKNITEIKEKPGEGNEPSKYIYMVGYYIEDSNEFIAELKQTTSDRDDVHERALSSLMKKHTFEMYPHTGGFATLKYPWHVLDVMEELFKRLESYKGNHVEIKQNVVIEGIVWIGDNVKIMENTKIVGPCYIGSDTIIGNNNIIRRSHIGSGCVTGFNTDITRSYVGDSCWFHSNYIGDSVLEGNVSMGSGSVLANLRLDEGEIFTSVNGERIGTKRNKLGAIIGKDVRIGVNVSIMPGIKVGKHSQIGAGVVLDKDLPDDSYCKTTHGYDVVENTHMVASHAREDFKSHV